MRLHFLSAGFTKGLQGKAKAETKARAAMAENNKENKEDQVKVGPEKRIFEQVSKDNLQGVDGILESGAVSVDITDEHGMTPLQHAAYRGNEAMCRMLLELGADVQGGMHNDNYTALHFAALSGNATLCQLLLEAGAKPYVLNSVGRTAAQMAAFVGNHHCASTINNYLDRKDVEYFTVPRGKESVAKLQPFLVTLVHNLVMQGRIDRRRECMDAFAKIHYLHFSFIQTNFHPVRIALFVKQNEILLDHIPEVIKVLELMSEREMKKGADTNEIIAFKIHLIAYMLRKMQVEAKGAKGRDPIDNFITKMLNCDTAGGIPEGLDRLVREGVRAFPFRDSAIMQQLVTNLTHTKNCEDPGAWSIVNGVVSGHKGFRDNDPCVTCGEERGATKCKRCYTVAYCDQECQTLHWFVHWKHCKSKAEELQKRSNDEAKSTPTKGGKSDDFITDNPTGETLENLRITKTD